MRRLAPHDDLAELTALLHAAYRGLAERGLRFVATAQSVETTRERAESGECFVARSENGLAATITLYPPGYGEGTPWYRRPDVAHFGQFGVRPDLQGKGVGRAMARHIEQRARELGARHLALDTSDQAEHLVAMYERWGYRIVERVRWQSVNYASVVMSKEL